MKGTGERIASGTDHSARPGFRMQASAGMGLHSGPVRTIHAVPVPVPSSFAVDIHVTSLS